MNPLERYDSIIARCADFDRKGKTMFYTSANGYMFSILNKAGEIGVRFSKERQEELFTKFNTTVIKSYGAVMRGYVLIPENMLEDLDAIAAYFNESYTYVMSLEPK